MHPYTSPRLPAVPILNLEASGPEFSRWRRTVKFALETKGTWKYCDGSSPMPMPETLPESIPETVIPKAGRGDGPSLLEERRAWVRHDREAKLDIFLSLAEEVMLDVFGVGPPLPPSNLSAFDMMEALAARFAAFNFEAYHHVFCHFLNLHIDQYDTLDDFNQEFSTTLDDLLDHGQPLSNLQACSAYFSKLRCTQNPWVNKMLEDWNNHSPELQLQDLMRTSPPWSIIRPLATKSSQHSHGGSISEDIVAHTDSDTTSEPSAGSIRSSNMTHSRQTSSTTMRSQDITISVAAKDLAIMGSCIAQKMPKALTEENIPDRQEEVVMSQKDQMETENKIVDWIDKRQTPPSRFSMAPINRPLPALPKSTQRAVELHTRNVVLQTPPNSDHPAFRDVTRSSEQLPTDFHPSVRPTTPLPRPSTANGPMHKSQVTAEHFSSHQLAPSALHPAEVKVQLPWPGTSDEIEGPAVQPSSVSTRSEHDLSKDGIAQAKIPSSLSSSLPSFPLSDHSPSANSSVLSLPLQGIRGDNAWDYPYQAHGKSLATLEGEGQHDLSPSSSSSITALPSIRHQHDHITLKEQVTMEPANSVNSTSSRKAHGKNNSISSISKTINLSIMGSTRFGGSSSTNNNNNNNNNNSGSSDGREHGKRSHQGTWERESRRRSSGSGWNKMNKKKNWSLSRFGTGKGIQEII